MFVASDSRKKIIEKRKDAFYETYVKSLVREAGALGITREELADMIGRAARE